MGQAFVEIHELFEDSSALSIGTESVSLRIAHVFRQYVSPRCSRPILMPFILVNPLNKPYGPLFSILGY
jgi:hypothetical protein